MPSGHWRIFQSHQIRPYLPDYFRAPCFAFPHFPGASSCQMGSAKKACRLFAVMERILYCIVRVIFSLFLAFRVCALGCQAWRCIFWLSCNYEWLRGDCTQMKARSPILLSMEVVVLWMGVQRKFSLNEHGNFFSFVCEQSCRKIAPVIYASFSGKFRRRYNQLLFGSFAQQLLGGMRTKGQRD